MLINLLTAIALFFVQPVFWLGLIIAVVRSQRRLRYERNYFNHAIFKERYEVRDYLTKGLIPGILFSLVVLGVGIPLIGEWVVIYQLVVLVLFFFGERFMHPIFSFSITSLLLFLFSHLELDIFTSTLPLVAELNSVFDRSLFEPLALSILTLILFMLFLSIWYLSRPTDLPLSPEVYETKRGKLSVRYVARTLTVIPLLTIIPGNSFGEWFEWWPVFDIGSQRYSFLILPVLSGFLFSLRSHDQETLSKKLPSSLKWSGALLFVGGVGLLYFLPEYLWTIFVVALILGIGNYIFTHYNERKKESNHKVNNVGVKIIGIRPSSPAAKIGLKIGDTILDINGHPIKNGESFKKELANNRLYAHLRIQKPDGDIILKETAIYENDPYDLGIILISHYANDR